MFLLFESRLGGTIYDATRMNRLMAVLLALTTSVLGLLVVAVLTGAGSAAAAPHPEFAPMLIGIDAGTLGAPIWSGYAVGILLIAMMWVTMLIGFRPGHWIHKAVSVWTVAYVASYVALMVSFRAYQAGQTSFAFGFTVPAAWLVYAIMLGPWILLLIIAFTFEKSYHGPEDEARFQEILADARAHDRPADRTALDDSAPGDPA